jgi:hypothetical protein
MRQWHAVRSREIRRARRAKPVPIKLVLAPSKEELRDQAAAAMAISTVIITRIPAAPRRRKGSS